MRATSITSVAGFVLAISVASAQTPDAKPSVAARWLDGSAIFDAGALREGRFTYRLTVKGQPSGNFVVTVRRQKDGTYRFTGEAIGSDQQWESVATKEFDPLSASLKMTRHGQPYQMVLTYEDIHAKALEISSDPETHGQTMRETVTALCPPTVDQRVDWAAVMASGLMSGKTARFYVFDPATRASAVRVAASEAPAISSPEGQHEVRRFDYTVQKNGAEEKYAVYATRETPRMMLREDLRENEVAELEKIEP